MNFSIKFIDSFLSDYITSSKTDSNRWCIERVLLSDLRDCSDSSVLYIGQSADGNIVCINRSGRITVYDAPLFDVFNAIVSRMQYYNDWELRAVRAAAASRDFQDCMDIFFELFPDSFIRVLDPMGREIYSNSGARAAALEPISLKLIRGIPQCHRIALGIRGTHLFWSEHYQKHFIFGNFVFDDGVYLFFSVRENISPLTDIQVHLAQLAQEIFERANYHSFDSASFAPYADVFLHLLEGQAPVDSEVGGLEAMTGWRISDGAYLALISCSQDDSFSAKALVLSIAEKISSSFAFSYKNDVICLLPESRFEKNVAVLCEIVDSVRFRAGISLRVSSWGDVSNAYTQAKLMLSPEHCASESSVIYCKDYMWQYFIRLFDSTGGRHMLHPDIFKLRAIDAQKGSQLLETLYCYLSSCCSMSQTAEHMHLHISTLKYRMSRINELISFDTQDYYNRMVFLLSYDLLNSPDLSSGL